MNFLTFYLSLLASAQAFAPSRQKPSSHANSSTMIFGNIEQIEFKIFPDGRIEETVTGVKGGECHKITEEINKNLGKVVASKPTEELYEQEITIAQTVQVNSNDGGWEGSSTW